MRTWVGASAHTAPISAAAGTVGVAGGMAVARNVVGGATTTTASWPSSGERERWREGGGGRVGEARAGADKDKAAESQEPQAQRKRRPGWPYDALVSVPNCKYKPCR